VSMRLRGCYRSINRRSYYMPDINSSATSPIPYVE
jgi:hypothetical protein